MLGVNVILKCGSEHYRFTGSALVLALVQDEAMTGEYQEYAVKSTFSPM